jgi:hypothetical protein
MNPRLFSRSMQHFLLFFELFSCNLIFVQRQGIIVMAQTQEHPQDFYYYVYDEIKTDQPKCMLSSDSQIIRCFMFSTWRQFITVLNSTNQTDLANLQVISTRPSLPIVLTGEADMRLALDGLCSKAPSSHACYNLYLDIAGLKGVDVIDGWTNSSSLEIYLNIFSSTLTFFMESQNKYQCSEEIMKKLTRGTLFNHFDKITFGPSVEYDQQIHVCPFLFANAKLTVLFISNVVDSFLVTNLFRFQQANSSFSSINSKIFSLYLTGYNINLDVSLVHPLVFEEIEQLNFEGSIASIQSDLLTSLFKQLDEVYLMLNSLANFYHQVGIEWIAHVGSDQSLWITFSDRLDGPEKLAQWVNPGDGVYLYPDKDLCMFAPWPIENSSAVVPILDTNLSVCTNSIAWLTQNYHLYDVTSDGHFTDNAKHISAICWNAETNNMTLIENKISNCQLQSLEINQKDSKMYNMYMDYYEIVYIFQFLVDLLAFVIVPFSCILGLLLNVRVGWTIVKNGKKDLDESFYKYMCLNSIFNCLFCLAYVFYPINFCEQYETGFFCSSIYNTVTAQVIKIVFQGFCGEVFKMCSNISYVFISINRYMLIGKDQNEILKKVSKLDFKNVIIFTVVFSMLMNIGHCFQYRINYGWGKLLNSFAPQNIAYDLYPSIVVHSSAFTLYTICYFVINFAVFFLINTLVEVNLVLEMRKTIAEKKLKAEQEIELSTMNNASGSEVINRLIIIKKKKIVEDAKKETKAIMMVISNSLVNFFLRLPEILIFFSSNSSELAIIVFGTNLQEITNYLVNNISSTMVSVSYFLYILTFTTNVAIYCVFNPKFKQLFIWW